MKAKPLTPKQAAFVREYLVDMNATRAATRAKYSKRTAEQQGHRLLRNAGVAKAVASALQKRAERLELTQDTVVRGLLIEAEDRSRGASHSARVSAWTALGKHLGIFVEKHEHTGAGGGPVEVIVTRRIVRAG
jgi:phage terminase small subunit